MIWSRISVNAPEGFTQELVKVGLVLCLDVFRVRLGA
jgi:hypothetical protein